MRDKISRDLTKTRLTYDARLQPYKSHKILVLVLPCSYVKTGLSLRTGILVVLISEEHMGETLNKCGACPISPTYTRVDRTRHPKE